jgi:curved DNA-binding protein CbpA/thioredoxin-related protein
MKILLILNIFLFTLLGYINCNHYKILGVNKDATEAEIKKAFKKLSLKFHPDKNKGNPEEAKKKFIEVANAYETLSDPNKRRIYDQHGEEGVKEHEARQNAGQQGGGFGGFGGGGNFEDMFSQFFQHQRGGRGGHGHHHFEEPEEQDYFPNSDVKSLKMENLSQLYRRKEIWFILFFKANDKEFKELAEMWKLLAEKSYGIFKIGAVNCRSDEEICEEFSVRTTPLIVYFPESSEDEEVYKGPKKMEDVFSFGAKRMQSFVRVINKDNYGDYVTENPAIHKVVLFTSRKSTSPLLKALSKHYKGKLSFGEIRQTEKELVERFGIKNFPTLFIITDHEKHQGVAYDGPLTRDSMEKFLSQYAYSVKKIEKEISVKELTNDVYNKQKICNDSDGKNICVIYMANTELLSGEENQQLDEIANKYKNDPIKVFYINQNALKFLWVSFATEDEGSKFIILRGKRGRYLPVKEASEINDALDNVLSGGGNFKKLVKKLNLVTKVTDRDEL